MAARRTPTRSSSASSNKGASPAKRPIEKAASTVKKAAKKVKAVAKKLSSKAKALVKKAAPVKKGATKSKGAKSAAAKKTKTKSKKRASPAPAKTAAKSVASQRKAAAKKKKSGIKGQPKSARAQRGAKKGAARSKHPSAGPRPSRGARTARPGAQRKNRPSAPIETERQHLDPAEHGPETPEKSVVMEAIRAALDTVDAPAIGGASLLARRTRIEDEAGVDLAVAAEARHTAQALLASEDGALDAARAIDARLARVFAAEADARNG